MCFLDAPNIVFLPIRRVTRTLHPSPPAAAPRLKSLATTGLNLTYFTLSEGEFYFFLLFLLFVSFFKATLR